jgi:hypothetical protein
MYTWADSTIFLELAAAASASDGVWAHASLESFRLLADIRALVILHSDQAEGHVFSDDIQLSLLRTHLPCLNVSMDPPASLPLKATAQGGSSLSFASALYFPYALDVDQKLSPVLADCRVACVDSTCLQLNIRLPGTPLLK